MLVIVEAPLAPAVPLPCLALLLRRLARSFWGWELRHLDDKVPCGSLQSTFNYQNHEEEEPTKIMVMVVNGMWC